MNKNLLVRLLALAIFLALITFIKGVVFPIIVAVIIYYGLKPLNNLILGWLPKNLPLKKDLAILTSFIFFLLLCLLIIEFIVPPFTSEFSLLVNNLPLFTNQVQSLIDSSQKLVLAINLPPQFDKAIIDGVKNALNYIIVFFEQIVSSLVGILAQFVSLVVMPIIVYYMLKEDTDLTKGIFKLVPTEHKEVFRRIFDRTNNILQSYVEGQLIICTGIGLITGLALYFLGIKFFLVLGLITAVTELIPIIGPLIGIIPALIIAFLISPELALKVLIIYVIIQSVGAYIISPKIMGNKLDLHPLTIVMAVLIWGSLIGVWGIFFAAPITAIIKVIYLEIGKS